MRNALYRSASAEATRSVFAEVCVLAPVGMVASTLLALASALLLVAATFLIEIPDRVRAAAVLMPSAGVVHVRSPSAGYVERLHVQVGEHVSAGQPLLDIGRDRATARVGSLRDVRRESVAREESLIREGHARRRELRQTRRTAANARLRHLRRTHAGLQAQERVAERQLELAERRLGRLRALVERGVLSVDQREQAEIAAAQAENARLDASAEVVGVEHELDAAKLALDELAAQAAADVVETDLRLARLRDQAIANADELERRLLAPIDGRIVYHGARAGDGVSLSQRLLAIIPDSATLEARVYVSSTDAAGLQAGQVVRLMLPGLPELSSQPLLATLSDIGRLALLPDGVDAPVQLSGPVFEMRATLSRRATNRLTPALAGGAGLSLRAEIVRKRRSLAVWFLQTVRPA